MDLKQNKRFACKILVDLAFNFNQKSTKIHLKFVQLTNAKKTNNNGRFYYLSYSQFKKIIPIFFFF